jgi:hypothetical protein
MSHQTERCSANTTLAFITNRYIGAGIAISHQCNGDANTRKIHEILLSVPSVSFLSLYQYIGAIRSRKHQYFDAKVPVAPFLLMQTHAQNWKKDLIGHEVKFLRL